MRARIFSPTIERLERRIAFAGLAAECQIADLDHSGAIDHADIARIADNYGGTPANGSQGHAGSAMGLKDVVAVQNFFGRECAWPTIRFAAFGDYGNDSPEEGAVADLVKSWNVDFVLTLGDNNYGVGAAETIDANIGKYYQEYIGNYVGGYGPGSATNRFFPSLGNHDWWTPGEAAIAPYLDYFDLPGNTFASSSNNERYYDFVWGPVHFFAVNSSGFETDGRAANSVQAGWLRRALGASRLPWQIVYFHESPYSSGSDSGSTTDMQWPFREWGADLVLSSHDHNYERLFVGNLTYLVAGTGGAPLRAMGSLVPGSIKTYNEAHGSLLITADTSSIRAEFRSIAGGDTLIDCVAIGEATCEAAASESPEMAPRAEVVRPIGAVSWRAEPLRGGLRAGRAVAEGDQERLRRPLAPIVDAALHASEVVRRSGRAIVRRGQFVIDADLGLD